MKIDVFCGVGNTFQYCLLTVYAGVVVLSWVFFEGLRMTQWRLKHVALTIYYFEVYEVNCIIDWHICVLYIYIYIYIYIYNTVCKFKNKFTHLLPTVSFPYLRLCAESVPLTLYRYETFFDPVQDIYCLCFRVCIRALEWVLTVTSQIFY